MPSTLKMPLSQILIVSIKQEFSNYKQETISDTLNADFSVICTISRLIGNLFSFLHLPLLTGTALDLPFSTIVIRGLTLVYIARTAREIIGWIKKKPIWCKIF